MGLLKSFKLTILFIIIASYDVSLVYALDPSEILVVANSRMDGSLELANYYMTKREIPKNNLLSLRLSLKETISRRSYDTGLRDKVVRKIKQLENKETIAAIVVVYGVPLKVEPPRPSWDELEQVRLHQNKISKLQQKSDKTDKDKKREEIKLLRNKITQLQGTNKRAAVDSELTLVKSSEYNLAGWVMNPYFVGSSQLKNIHKKNQVLLVSRLDGPDVKTVYRIINDSIYAEKHGLKGIAYFDARWPYSSESTKSGYELYDSSIHLAGKVTQKRIKTIVDDKEQLFKINSCPNAALYCGWYSLGKYVDSFTWERGAVGYHIASAEAATLRDKRRSLWCLKMLEKGVAATIGPVYEPYVQGFPLPEIFFSYLTEGYMSLGEAYLVSQPYISWQTILIGDPLYKPFSPKE